jgi:hypothetical protein
MLGSKALAVALTAMQRIDNGTSTSSNATCDDSTDVAVDSILRRLGSLATAHMVPGERPVQIGSAESLGKPDVPHTILMTAFLNPRAMRSVLHRPHYWFARRSQRLGASISRGRPLVLHTTPFSLQRNPWLRHPHGPCLLAQSQVWVRYKKVSFVSAIAHQAAV